MAKEPEIMLDLPDEWYQDVLERLAGDMEAVAKAAAESITDVKTTVTMKRDGGGRPVAMLTLAEAKGIAHQAKYGTLTRAAASQGLRVVRYPPR